MPRCAAASGPPVASGVPRSMAWISSRMATSVSLSSWKAGKGTSSVRKVCERLGVRLEPAEEARLRRLRPTNPRAYELYLRGRLHWNRLTEQEVRTAPGYEPAWRIVRVARVRGGRG